MLPTIPFPVNEVLRRAREGGVSLAGFKPDPGTFVVLPYAPGAAAMLSDQVNPDGLIPVDESLCYLATGFHLAHDYTIDLVDALNKQGLEVEHHHPELGHGQHWMRF
jgi:glutamine synthetase